jgi:hypothetical protein
MDLNRSKRKIVVVLSAILFLMVLMLWQFRPPRGGSAVPVGSDPTGTRRFHTTQFPHTENPIAEGGNWTVSGGDFADVRTIPGLAFGAQTGTKKAPAKFGDSTALLTGNWGPDQFVQIVVHYTGAPTESDYDEVEIRLRSAISAKSNTGYEINCRVGRLGMWGYIQVGKVNGPVGDFTGPFDEKKGEDYSCHDGDVIVGTVTGTTLKAYLNGEQVLQATDSTFASGAPGIGFYHQGTQAQNSDFGISSVFEADHAPANWQSGYSPARIRIQHWVRHFRVWLEGFSYRLRRRFASS